MKKQLTPLKLIEKLRKAKVGDFELVDKELKLGCEVDVGWTTEPRRSHYVTVLKVLRSNTYKICNLLRNTSYKGAVLDVIEYQDNFTIERTPLPEIFEILGTPPSMQRVMAFFEKRRKRKKSWNNIKVGQGLFDIFDVWTEIDTQGTMNFFELIENAGEHYEDIHNFCQTYLLS